MVKVTFTLDAETVARIRQAARRHAKPQSAIVREAVADYAARADATSHAEREHLIRALDNALAAVPERSARDVAAEIRAIRTTRRASGRRSTRAR